MKKSLRKRTPTPGQRKRRQENDKGCFKKFRYVSHEVATAYLKFFPHLRGVHWCKVHECWHMTSGVGQSANSIDSHLIARDQEKLIRTIPPQLWKAPNTGTA